MSLPQGTREKLVCRCAERRWHARKAPVFDSNLQTRSRATRMRKRVLGCWLDSPNKQKTRMLRVEVGRTTDHSMARIPDAGTTKLHPAFAVLAAPNIIQVAREGIHVPPGVLTKANIARGLRPWPHCPAAEHEHAVTVHLPPIQRHGLTRNVRGRDAPLRPPAATRCWSTFSPRIAMHFCIVSWSLESAGQPTVRSRRRTAALCQMRGAQGAEEVSRRHSAPARGAHG